MEEFENTLFIAELDPLSSYLLEEEEEDEIELLAFILLELLLLVSRLLFFKNSLEYKLELSAVDDEIIPELGMVGLT